MKTLRTLFFLGSLLGLAACGGGGDSGSVSSAEGIWSGVSSTGYKVDLVVLENGETWGVYTANNLIYGALYGVTLATGSNLTGTGSDFNIPYRTVTSSNYTGNVSAKNAISVRSNSGASFSGTYVAAYDLPASLSTLAGTFQGWALTGKTTSQSVTVTISSSGLVSMPASAGCTTSGSVSPRTGGKNIFNLGLNFSGVNCALGNGSSANGVLYYDTSSRQLLAMGMNAAKSDGFIAFGTKQ